MAEFKSGNINPGNPHDLGRFTGVVWRLS